MFRINYDALGIAASLACAIHCAVLPLLISSLPVFGTDIIDNSFFEYLMIAVAMAVGLHSLWHGYRKHHGRIAPMMIFGTGMVLMLLKQLFHSHQLYFLIPAVVAIVVAHLYNFQMCKKAGCRH